MTSLINPAAFRVVHNRPYTSSIVVADYFEKEHKNVLRLIDDLCAQVPDFLLKLNFEPKEKTVKTGVGTERKTRYFLIDQKAFTILVMGFTGEKALRFKLAFYEEFERMQKALSAPQAPAPKIEAPKPGKLSVGAHNRLAAAITLRMSTAPTQKSVQSRLYTAVARRFGVKSYKDIPPEKIGEAVEYILTADPETAGSRVSENAHNLQLLAKRLESLENEVRALRKEKRADLRAVNSFLCSIAEAADNLGAEMIGEKLLNE